MAKTTVNIRMDTSGLRAWLSALTQLAERLPEVRDGLLGYLDSGEELFRFDVDRGAATVTGECIVRLYPSDALLGLLSASGAGDTNLLLVEHGTSPEVESRHHITTSHYPQSGATK